MSHTLVSRVITVLKITLIRMPLTWGLCRHIDRCNDENEEDNVKDKSKEEALQGEEEDERTATSAAAKTLCIPYDQPELPEGTKCFFTGRPAVNWTLWGRSY